MGLSDINWVLVAVTVLFAIKAVAGYRKGLVKKLISLLAMAVAIVAIALIAAAVKNYTDRNMVNAILAMIFLVLLLLGMQLSKIITGSLKLLAKLPLVSGVNKLAGLVFGLLEGMVVVWTVFLLLGLFSMGTVGAFVMDGVWKNSFLTLLYENNWLVKWIVIMPGH